MKCVFCPGSIIPPGVGNIQRDILPYSYPFTGEGAGKPTVCRAFQSMGAITIFTFIMIIFKAMSE